ncbi:MAG: aminopeptidase P family protein [Clostridiales bacterium]|nr:aminopeptidase P family protein [Clostridiales bacterium]
MKRIQKLIAAVALAPEAGILVHKPSNIFYLSGYTGEGLLLITGNTTAILTDFRYVEQAQQEAPGFVVHQITGQLSYQKTAASLFEKEGINTVYYEDDFITVRSGKTWAEALEGVTLLSLDNKPELLREIKDEQEIALIEKACAISSAGFEYICTQIKSGMTELAIKRLLENHLMDLGASATAFDTIVASGPNGSLPHAIPGDRVIQDGDIITLDFGARYKGYCSDMTRTVSVGQPSAKMLEIFNIVLEAQKASQAALKPGAICKDMDDVARSLIAKAGYSEYFGHGLGHGVGIDVHENPRLSATCSDPLQPGHVVTVEPGIYLPGIGGVRIENTCVIAETGAHSLVTASRELRIL